MPTSPMVNDILERILQDTKMDGLDRTDLAGLVIQTATAASALNEAASYARKMGRSRDEEDLLQAFDAVVIVIGHLRTLTR